MREIKFRLIRNGKIVGYESHVIDKSINEGICVYHKTPNEKEFKYGYPITGGDKWFIKHEKKEQYTGLKDKKGKEIYEDDIVKYKTSTCRNHKFVDVEYIGQIIYRKSGFCIYVKGEKFEFMILHNDVDVEVIGNIYKNPELIGR